MSKASVGVWQRVRRGWVRNGASNRIDDGAQLAEALRAAGTSDRRNADLDPCHSGAYECGLNVYVLNTKQHNSVHCRPIPVSILLNVTMPPKQRTSAPQTVPGTPYSAAKPKSSNDAQDILQGVWNRYVEKTPQRTKLLDSFMLFLVVVGALQFAYVVLVGNFVSPI